MHMRNLVQQHERNVVNLYTPNLGNRCADVASLGDEVLVSFRSFDKVRLDGNRRFHPSESGSAMQSYFWDGTL